MEALVGPTFSIDVPSSPMLLAYGGDHPTADIDRRAVLSALLDGGSGYRAGGRPLFFAGKSSESLSSISTPDDSDNENDDVLSQEEVRSKLKGLDSLEDYLPIKFLLAFSGICLFYATYLLNGVGEVKHG